MSLHTDERGILLSGLLKITLFFAVVGVTIFDIGSIAVNIFTLDSAADDTAVALSLSIDPNAFGTDDHRVFEQAQLLIASDETLAGDAKVVRNGTRIDEEGVVYVTLRRVADTIVVDQISALRKWGRATAEGSAGTN